MFQINGLFVCEQPFCRYRGRKTQIQYWSLAFGVPWKKGIVTK